MKSRVSWDVHDVISQNRELFGFQSNVFKECGRHFTFEIYRRIDMDTGLRFQIARGWMKVQYISFGI
jgi:hypothetical protein